MTSCGFTGHRKIEQNVAYKIPTLLKKAIREAIELGASKFLAGGAMGFDTIAARQVIQFRIAHPDCELHLLIPCRNQSERWSDRQRDMYEYTLSAANTVSYLTDEYRDGCMRLRNQRLVDLSDIVIAYVGRDKSGAAQTVRMAQRAGKTFYNLYPTLDRS